VSFALLVCAIAPLKSGFQFGGDEGFELMKALLINKGYLLYHDIWNDQPPLHTWLVAYLFNVFGPSAFVGRLLSVVLASLLISSLYRLIRKESGPAAATIAIILLIASSNFLFLSVSTIIELPAMALAVTSMLIFFKRFDSISLREEAQKRSSREKLRVLASGALFGLALQVKLTAVLFVPAIVIAGLIRAERSARVLACPNRKGCRAHALDVILWLATVALSFCAVTLLYPAGTLEVFWNSHFSTAFAPMSTAESDEYVFRIGSLLSDYGVCFPAVVGTLSLLWLRPRRSPLPVILLATALLVHASHRPYWWYYHLHFAIPLAWLAGVGTNEVFIRLSKKRLSSCRLSLVKECIAYAICSVVFGLIVVGSFEKISNWIGTMKSSSDALKHPVVLAMRERRGDTQWVFTDDVIYAFHAGLLVPPELAVIPKKRVWSGQISDAQILREVQRYRPEQIYLAGQRMRSPSLMRYIETNYVSIQLVGHGNLYLQKQDGPGTKKEREFPK
jgi:dolichyl-phosphate-mannose-protein mannosyltransferase